MNDTAMPRRQFELIAADRVFLDRLALPWEAVVDAGARRVVIYGMKLPAGYNQESAAVNVRLEVGYPEAQIDMAYFLPHLTRADNKPIAALSDDQFDGKTWQRWSRHRTAASAWRIGEDNLETHLALVCSWLQDELLR